MRANHTPARGINPEGWGVIITLLYGRAELIYTTYKYYNIPILSLTLIELNVKSTLSESMPSRISFPPAKGQAGRRGAEWLKKFGPRGPNFLSHPRGSGKEEGQMAQEVWPSRAKLLVSWF